MAPFYIEVVLGRILYGYIRQRVAKYRGSLKPSRLYTYIFNLKFINSVYILQNKLYIPSF